MESKKKRRSELQSSKNGVTDMMSNVKIGIRNFTSALKEYRKRRQRTSRADIVIVIIRMNIYKFSKTRSKDD